MFTATWDWLWVKHDQVKELFRLFIKPTEMIEKKKMGKPDETSYGGSNSSNGGSGSDDKGGDNRIYTKAQLIGLILGPLLFVITLFFVTPEGLSYEGRAILASTLWIAVWWMTEAAPIPVTSLLPIVLFPLTSGLDLKTTAASYSNDTIFLFLGGFVIALAMEKWNLHRRIAVTIIHVMGTNTDRIVLGFMVATGFLSMWISNTATAMMMVPIGLAIIYQVTDALKDNPTITTNKMDFPFGKSLMLGIAYAASIGGMATLIGTPPNAILAAQAKEMFGYEISFAKWMLFGVPFAWVFLFLGWYYLTKIAFPLKLKSFPGGREIIEEEKRKLGKASYEEKAVFIVFILTALAWIFAALLKKIIPGIGDALIAVTSAIILFLIPTKNRRGDFLMDWKTAANLPWGILLLFGGGLTIAKGFTQSGLSEWIGTRLNSLQGVSIILIVLAVTILVNALTEVTSNTATATMMYPIMGALAMAINVNPIVLMVAAGLSASCAFMLPVATPPNAVVFGSGYLRIPDMVKAGFFLNVVAIVLVTVTVYFLVPLLFGFDIGVFPDSFR